MAGEDSKKLIIGFITYGEVTAKYLPYFLSSLSQQTFREFKIIAVDNSEEKDNKNIKYIEENYPDIEITWTGENLGFAKAYNRMIDRAVAQKAKYFLALNPDMTLEQDAIEILVKALEGDEQLGAVCPKILRWDFNNNKKTNLIDTIGIRLLPGLRFIDLGQGKIDCGQFDEAEILGPSGAAGLFRLSALQKVASAGKYFDEMMFMYKEDCDLAYRLFLANFKSKSASKAIAYHARTASASGVSDMAAALDRKNKSRQVKEWSFKNQLIIYYKYWRIQKFKDKFIILWRASKMLVFVILFEQYLLRTLIDFYNNKKNISQFKSG